MQSQSGETYPWYDDRVEVLRSSATPSQDIWEDLLDEDDLPPRYDTPKAIYDFLGQRVWKQDEAKRAASVIMYQCLQEIKTNAMFIGPTGCGKTHVWRCLREAFPDRISIVDASNITQDGWRGEKKWADLLASPIFYDGKSAICVLDEIDKLLAPKFTSHDENYSHNVQAEGLTMIEGTRVIVKDGSVAHEVDTSKISFVLCGAFSAKAHAIAEQASPKRIGFGADMAAKAPEPYARPLDETDLLDYGVMPEFLGRIHRIVNLQPMTAEDYYRMTEGSGAVLSRLREQYGADIRLTDRRRRELAEEAARSGLGVRGMEARIRRLMDDALFENHELRTFEL